MKITYLKHSGYVVEDAGRAMVFDYYEGNLPDFLEAVKLYVFVSHVHYDHFNPQIFQWKDQYPDIQYILSNDIEEKGFKESCTFVGPGQEVVLDGIKIRTLRSTDEGVAFLVQAGERRIYHAGDLNWWHWEEESRVYNEMMRRRFLHEMEKLEGESVDVAFLPLDPRQEEQYAWGFDYFMRHTRTGCAFPMHFWEEYEVYDRLIEDTRSEPYRQRVMKVSKPQQSFEV
ncbi:MAG: MBL fold metallo-hydrolase [Dorea sp.]|jgi:L-ascorbate metabolism protein UlaG (beta-lactamase superfamily)|uniref:MBL fold metallo-hydrolase n=1 Tax=Sporofaciens musculi TaxID=2681861 RepID=UPI0021736143|nr:MBL fold metallo-hydrolase [Sporofaciens musculi]MCI9421497.1 MBL fold metallo-hydrolase [Dorea sp.]